MQTGLTGALNFLFLWICFVWSWLWHEAWQATFCSACIWLGAGTVWWIQRRRVGLEDDLVYTLNSLQWCLPWFDWLHSCVMDCRCSHIYGGWLDIDQCQSGSGWVDFIHVIWASRSQGRQRLDSGQWESSRECQPPMSLCAVLLPKKLSVDHNGWRQCNRDIEWYRDKRGFASMLRTNSAMTSVRLICYTEIWQCTWLSSNDSTSYAIPSHQQHNAVLQLIITGQ